MTPERPVSRPWPFLTGAAARLVLALLATAALVIGAAATVAAESPGASAGPSQAAGGGGAAPAASGGSAISIVGTSFQPTTLTVHVGDTVTWTVTQGINQPHSVTSGTYKDAQTAGKDFDSGITLKNNGDTFSHTFTAAGTYPFFCAVHPDTMSGTITVAEAGGGSGAPAEAGVPTSSKVVAAVVLIVALVILFLGARLYQRFNRA